MPRTIKTEDFDVYQLGELEEHAREKAIEAIAEKLGGDWWDSDDIDDVSDVIRYTLANEFGTPGHGDYGVADFPGIDGVKLDGWDLDRGSYVLLRGTLTRENAPRLPWTNGAVEVDLAAGRNGTSISVEFDTSLTDDDLELINDQIEDAVRAAMHAALKSGRKEMEYKTSAEYAKEAIEANGYEFLKDGTPYFG